MLEPPRRMSLKCLLCLLICVGTGAVSSSQNPEELNEALQTEITLDLQGRWREDQNQRTGLNDMMYYMGMSWWRRLYIVTISWESEQTIFQKNHEFRIHGTKGPQAEVYSYKLTADNSTISYISLSEFGGGWMKAKAYVEDEGGKQSLVAELENKDTGNVDVILKRTRKKGSKQMVQEFQHVPTNTIQKSVFYKQ